MLVAQIREVVVDNCFRRSASVERCDTPTALARKTGPLFQFHANNYTDTFEERTLGLLLISLLVHYSEWIYLLDRWVDGELELDLLCLLLTTSDHTQILHNGRPSRAQVTMHTHTHTHNSWSLKLTHASITHLTS